jgi:hypothetical protein
MNKYFVDTNEDERRLSFLPEDKRSQLLALRDKIEGMRENVLEAANGNPSAADLEALRKIEEQRRAELGKLLSGSELAEFELRMSGTADQLRAELIGFNPSESEFRAIFEMQQAIEEKFAFADANDESVQQQKLAAQKDIQEEIRRQLGDARYADYEKKSRREPGPDGDDARRAQNENYFLHRAGDGKGISVFDQRDGFAGRSDRGVVSAPVGSGEGV